jgi:hypothetical protein
MLIIPEAFGTSHYDNFFKSTLFHRGLAVGPVWSYKRCFEEGANRAGCPKGVLKETFVGGAMDLRVSDKIAPRFTIGRREQSLFVTTTGSVEGGIQLLYSFK